MSVLKKCADLNHELWLFVGGGSGDWFFRVFFFFFLEFVPNI